MPPPLAFVGVRQGTPSVLTNSLRTSPQEHLNKTYCMICAVAAEVERLKLEGVATIDFLALGQFRSIEKARAHLCSSSALGIFDLDQFCAQEDAPSLEKRQQ